MIFKVMFRRPTGPGCWQLACVSWYMYCTLYCLYLAGSGFVYPFLATYLPYCCALVCRVLSPTPLLRL